MICAYYPGDVTAGPEVRGHPSRAINATRGQPGRRDEPTPCRNGQCVRAHNSYVQERAVQLVWHLRLRFEALFALQGDLVTACIALRQLGEVLTDNWAPPPLSWVSG